MQKITTYSDYIELINNNQNLTIEYNSQRILKSKIDWLNETIKSKFEIYDMYGTGFNFEYIIDESIIKLYQTNLSCLNSFGDHLSYYSDLTNNECEELATNEFGIDAERALLNIVERDFCKQYLIDLKKDLLEYIKQ